MEVTREFLESLQSFKSEGDYRDSPSLNYSTLKQIPLGPKCLVTERKELDSPAINIGSYADTYFTNRDELSNLFYVERSDIQLTDSMMAIYLELASRNMLEPSKDEVVEVCREIGVYSSIKDDEKVKARITDDLLRKLSELKDSMGKKVITSDEYNQAMIAISNITNTPATMAMISESEDEIIIDQFKYEFSLLIENTRRMFRIMIDKLKFNKKTKRITIIDIKTGKAHPMNFGKQFADNRYDIQAVLYYMGVLRLISATPELNGWTCLPEDFVFVYGSKIKSTGIIVHMTDDFMSNNDNTVTMCGTKYDGFMKILKDANWYITNQEFEINRSIIENEYNFSIEYLI